MHVAYQLSASTIFRSSCIQYFISFQCGYTRVYISSFHLCFSKLLKILISLSDPFRSNFPETQVNPTHLAGTGSITAVQQSSELLSVEPLQQSKTKKGRLLRHAHQTGSLGFTGWDIHVAYHAQLRIADISW